MQMQKQMHSIRTGGLKIMRGVASMRARKRTIAHIALGWLLVLGVAACGGTDEDSVATTAAPAMTTYLETESVSRTVVATTAMMSAGTAAPATTAAQQQQQSYPATTPATTTLAAPSPTAAPAYDSAAQAEDAGSGSAYSAPAPQPSLTTFRDYARARFVSTLRGQGFHVQPGYRSCFVRAGVELGSAGL